MMQDNYFISANKNTFCGCPTGFPTGGCVKRDNLQPRFFAQHVASFDLDSKTCKVLPSIKSSPVSCNYTVFDVSRNVEAQKNCSCKLSRVTPP